jgi:hypothetical protein
MTADVLSFPTADRRTSPAPAAPRPPAFDPAFSALPLFHRLRDSLTASARLIAACRKRHARTSGRWGVPALFFFQKPAAPVGPEFPHPYLGEVAPKMPAELAAWEKLPDLLDDALTVLPAVEARRTARTVDGLQKRAAELADVLPAVKELSELLAVPDDQVVLAIHPASRTGMRVLLRGVAEVHQLHVLLSSEWTGPRPDPRVTAACRDTRPDPDASVFLARWQLFHPSALLPDGTLPRGLGASDSWVWGEQSPAVLPLEKGERVVLLGEPTYRAGWEVGRKFPRVNGDLEVVERLSAVAVTDWLAKRCPQLPAVRERLAA